MADVVRDHRLACDRFGVAVRTADGRWDAPSPCTEWDARAVLEHVIGFHDVLILRPLDAKPRRPKDDPDARWDRTVEAMFSVLAAPGVLTDERRSLLAALTTDVLVHTWDLAKATGAPADLDPELCRIGLERALAGRARMEASGMFAPTVKTSERAPAQDRLLAFFGRDPAWTAPQRS